MKYKNRIMNSLHLRRMALLQPVEYGFYTSRNIPLFMPQNRKNRSQSITLLIHRSQTLVLIALIYVCQCYIPLEGVSLVAVRCTKKLSIDLTILDEKSEFHSSRMKVYQPHLAYQVCYLSISSKLHHSHLKGGSLGTQEAKEIYKTQQESKLLGSS